MKCKHVWRFVDRRRGFQFIVEIHKCKKCATGRVTVAITSDLGDVISKTFTYTIPNKDGIPEIKHLTKEYANEV